MQFASSSTVPADAIRVHSLSTPVHEHELDSDGEDYGDEWGVTVVISEEVRQIDEDDEERSRSEGSQDDSIHASESE